MTWIRGARMVRPAYAALLALSMIGCRAEPSRPPEPDAAAGRVSVPSPTSDSVVLDAEAQQRGGLVVSPVGEMTRADATTAPGLVALNETRTARIGSLVDGIVMAVDVQPGAHVKGRQELASLHSHVVHDSWAGYRKAKADERRLQTELRFATEAQGRAERLYAAKAIALQDFQRAEANRVAAEEALDIGRTEVRRAEEELEHLGITSGDDPTGESGEQIPVRTPFAGVVLERLVTQGTAVTPGTLMFVVSDLSTVWVLAELDEAHLAGAEVGRAVAVRVPAYPNEAFPGTVTYISEMLNPKTRRVTVRCEVRNVDGRLKPDMYATVDISQGQPRTMTVVPGAAIQSVNGRPSVFVSEANHRFRVQPVDVGTEENGLVEIRHGVMPGDRIVTSGAFIVKSELLKSSGDAGE